MSKKSLFCHLFSAIVFLMIFLGFFGCNNLTGGNNKPSSDNDDKVYLQVNVASASRTALPQFDLDSIKDFKFELEGKKDGASSFTAIAIFEDEPDNLDNLKNEQIPIETGAWIFRLIASKDGTVLSDEISKTITTGANTISFDLKWEDETLSGTGGISFTLDFSEAPNTSDVAYATTELLAYNSSNGEYETSVAENSIGFDNSKVIYSPSNLNAGKYKIIIRLYADTAKTKLLQIWPELAIVTGGQISTGSRTLTSLNELYSITWDGLDDINETLTLPEAYTRFSSEYTLPTISKDDWIFGGWYDSSDFENANLVTSLEGLSGNKQFYARWQQIYATVNDTPYADKDSTINAIKNGTGNLNVVLRGIVPQVDIGSAGTLNKIMNAIYNTTAASVSLSVAAGETITLTGCYFSGCSKLVSLDMTGFDTSAVTSMEGMFQNDSSLTNLDISTLNTSAVTDMSSMFEGCSNLTTIDLSQLDTSNVTDFEGMFRNCSSITSLDITALDTSKAVEITGMFEGCSSLTTLDLSHFAIPENVNNYGCLFKNCSGLTTLDLSNFDTSNILSMYQMFYGCSALTSLDLSNFNTANVSSMEEMFRDCTNLVTITVSDSFVLSRTSSAINMFKGCTNLAGCRSTVYDPDFHINEYVNDKPYAHIDGGTGYPGYFTPSCYAKVGSTICNDVSEIVTAIEAVTANIDICIFGDGSFTAENLGSINAALANLSLSHSSVEVTIDVSYIGELTQLEDVASSPAYATGTHKAFNGCNNVTTITLPPGLQYIGAFAFYQCVKLETINVPDVRNDYNGITLPDSVTTIGSYAFSNCPQIGHVEIPAGISALPDYIFSNCSGITSITIPENITSIGNSAFDNCDTLETVYFANDEDCILQSIGNYAFNRCTSLGSMYLRSSVKTLGNNAFNGCSGLADISLNSVESIGDYCFKDCTYLTNISIPDTLTTFGTSPFKGSGLRSFYVSNTMTEIPASLLEGCASLNSVTLGNTITTIGNNAFKDCTALTSLNIPDTVMTMGNGVFNGSGITSLMLPSSVTSIGTNFCNGCTSLTYLAMDDTSITQIPNSAFYNCPLLEEVFLPATVTSIGERAFYNCSNLSMIDLPTGLASIGQQSFCSTGLTSITIPASVTSIESQAFYSSSNLASATFENTTGWKNNSNQTVDVSVPSNNVSLVKNGLLTRSD